MTIFANLTDTTLYFSRLQGVKVRKENQVILGKITDFFVDYEEIYPQVLALQIKRGGKLLYIEWKDVISFDYNGVLIKQDAHEHRSRTFPKVYNHKVITSLLANQFRGRTVDYPSIGKVILDRQIVDTSGKKVVRVNDILFIKLGKSLRITHAAIGFRSIVRRLGYEKIIDGTIKLFNKNAKYLKNNISINWKYVHALPDKSFQKNVKLSLDNEEINSIHPADLADILEDLDGHAREQLFSNLDHELAAETLSELEDDIQTKLIKKENPENAAKILEKMDPDEAVDLLSELHQRDAKSIIDNITDQDAREDIEELLAYEEDTAGGLMSTEEFQVSPDITKQEVLGRIQAENDDIESIYDIYIVDNSEKLIGTCPLNKVLIQKENIAIRDIMNHADIKSLHADTPWREVAEFMSKYNLINVPITDENSKLLGIVSVDDVLPWLLDEK